MDVVARDFPDGKTVTGRRLVDGVHLVHPDAVVAQIEDAQDGGDNQNRDEKTPVGQFVEDYGLVHINAWAAGEIRLCYNVACVDPALSTGADDVIPNKSPHHIRVGPAGWQYPDWNGTFYPPRKPRGFDALQYTSSYFDVIEVNSTFYRVPGREMCRSWAERTAALPAFRFTLKAHRLFTHTNENPAPVAFDDFKKAIDPLLADEKLQAILLQFPWSFKPDDRCRKRLQGLVHDFRPFPLAIEVRHGDWMAGEGRQFLESLNTTVCGVDQPVIGNSVAPFTHIAGAAGAYFRFHGRNYKTWFARNVGRDARYDYSYSEKELRDWIGVLKSAAESAQNVTVIMNNHFRGQAPANAFELMAMLNGEKVAAPALLRTTYPRLRESTFGYDAHLYGPRGTGGLFDDLESVPDD